MSGRGTHLGEALTCDQIRDLPDGAEVVVTWSGGNGPWPYLVIVDRWGSRLVDNVYADPLLTGLEQVAALHRVTRGWDDQARAWRASCGEQPRHIQEKFQRLRGQAVERHVIHEPVATVHQGAVRVSQDEEHIFATNPACGKDNTFPPAGGLSMRCGARYFGCDDLSCTCVCHDQAEEYRRQLDKEVGLRLEDVRRLFDIPAHLLPRLPEPPAAPYAPACHALPWDAFVGRYPEVFRCPPAEPLCCRMSTADLDKLRAGTLQLDPDLERELKRHATIPTGVPDSMRPLFGLPIVIDETAVKPRLEPIPPSRTEPEELE